LGGGGEGNLEIWNPLKKIGWVGWLHSFLPLENVVINFACSNLPWGIWQLGWVVMTHQKTLCFHHFAIQSNPKFTTTTTQIKRSTGFIKNVRNTHQHMIPQLCTPQKVLFFLEG
jgi:hypothetical protein